MGVNCNFYSLNLIIISTLTHFSPHIVQVMMDTEPNTRHILYHMSVNLLFSIFVLQYVASTTEVI